MIPADPRAPGPRGLAETHKEGGGRGGTQAWGPAPGEATVGKPRRELASVLPQLLTFTLLETGEKFNVSFARRQLPPEPGLQGGCSGLDRRMSFVMLFLLRLAGIISPGAAGSGRARARLARPPHLRGLVALCPRCN